MNPLRWYLAALVTIALILIVTGNAFAQRVDDMTPAQRLQQNELDLRFMQREIAKMRYSEVCATIVPPPQNFAAVVKDAAEKGNEDAQGAWMWMVRIMEAYAKAGCGDA